ncbi:hypothetical protein ACFL9U_06385 [Thermodesulfobacteriota bacterium]
MMPFVRELRWLKDLLAQQSIPADRLKHAAELRDGSVYLPREQLEKEWSGYCIEF